MKKARKIYKLLKQQGLINSETEKLISKELYFIENKTPVDLFYNSQIFINQLYSSNDFEILQGINLKNHSPLLALKTLKELLENDKKREKDGFPRKIRLGKLLKPGEKGKVIIVPTTTEPKFYHDNSVTQEDTDENDIGETGGTGKENEGEVIGEQKAQPQQGEGEGQGAGEGGESNHEIGSDAFEIGKILTQEFQLPNLKQKGNKRSLTKYVYDLTDKNRGFGQILDKKATIKKIIETNILLGKININDENLDLDNLIINPDDHIFRILSKEKTFESQALVFFVRDYSGSMQGAPTEAIISLHLLIYSWLMYQYKNRVETRFILHDTEAKEVNDFYTYYKSTVAGGTQVSPAFKKVNEIVKTENLAKDYNIYIFYGTDGDDWDSSGEKTIEEIKKALIYTNRIGITVARNSWTTAEKTTVEKYLDKSGLLKSNNEKIKIDSFKSDGVEEKTIIESIKKIIS